MELRNVAIIAHVDHGKTTLVDGLLKQSKTFRENEPLMSAELIMDSNDQERERGITILAKNTAVIYNNVKINIIDTPGHADFGGEVERTLNMADGALLLVDAQEGPMPQTKFVLKKALELGLKIIVIINKVDKKDARTKETLNKVHDLILELATDESHLDAPVLYAIGREAKSWEEIPDDFQVSADLAPIFEAILKFVPAPVIDDVSPFQMLVSTLDWDNYKGKYAIGRVKRGKVNVGDKVVLIHADGTKENGVVETVFVNQGLKRVEVSAGTSGDIISITGIKNANIGDTIADINNPEALPTIRIADPTLSMSIGPNTSPFMGKDGKFLTSRQILERIERELQTNVAMRFHISPEGQYIVSGRGELHLSVFLETLRREGYEMEIGKPKVITKEIDGVEVEPVEEVTIDVENEFVGAVKSELGKRRGVLILQEETTSQTTRMVFELTTRAILGLRSTLLTLSKGTAVMNSVFIRYEKKSADLQKMRRGVLVASDTGKTAAYGLVVAQDKGPVFVGPQVPVYEGMIVGINGRDDDLEINVCKEKQLTNNRSVGEDAVILTPPIYFSLEQYIGFLEDDELLEITPKNLRLRKKILNKDERYKARKRS
jgi:GTP-binding protein